MLYVLLYNKIWQTGILFRLHSIQTDASWPVDEPLQTGPNDGHVCHETDATVTKIGQFEHVKISLKST